MPKNQEDFSDYNFVELKKWLLLQSYSAKVAVGMVECEKSLLKIECESSSVGRARPCQGRGRGFEPRLSLQEQTLNKVFIEN